MERNIVIRVPEYKDPLEEMIARTDYSLERLIGIEETPLIKAEADINSIKPILINLEKKLDEQNHKKGKTSPKLTAKEKLLIMEYLLNPIVGKGQRTQKNVNNLLSVLCDLDESSIKSASKDISKKYVGYTSAATYVYKLENTKKIFENFIPKSYDEKNIAHGKLYEKIHGILNRIDKDIDEAKNKK